MELMDHTALLTGGTRPSEPQTNLPGLASWLAYTRGRLMKRGSTS
jgi:hypothetical protein